MGRTYTVAGESFTTQKSLLEQLRRILYSYDDGDAVSREHRRFLYSLVDTYHPSSELKIGCGVARIEVRQNPVYKNNRGFWIVRTDGTETDFSFMECLRPSKQIDKSRSACRAAVRPSIVDFVHQFWGNATSATCPITGEEMTSDDCHVHHAGEWSFEAIVQGFIRDHDIDIDDVSLSG